MCTVTIVPAGEAVRLACNRDEQRSRPAALPPRVRRFGRRRAVLPVDPVSGGTWVAVSDAGLAAALLNVNAERGGAARGSPTRSRGSVIPSLLGCDTLTQAVSRATSLDAAAYAPFRLVLADREGWAELRSDGDEVRLLRRRPAAGPALFTSSGLGDRLVEGPRQALFAELFDRPGDPVARQDRFHRHRWHGLPHLSVCMSRADARTVSHTVVTMGWDAVTLTYHPDAPDRPAAPALLSLPVATGVVA
jgi:hypothetical protein